MKNIKSVFDAPNKWYVGLHGRHPIYENDISDYLMRVPPNIAIVTFVNTGLFGWSTDEDENKLRKFLFNKNWIFSKDENNENWWKDNAKLYLPGDIIYNIELEADIKEDLDYFNIWRKRDTHSSIKQTNGIYKEFVVCPGDKRKREYIPRLAKDNNIVNKPVELTNMYLSYFIRRILNISDSDKDSDNTYSKREKMPQHILYMFTCQPDGVSLPSDDIVDKQMFDHLHTIRLWGDIYAKNRFNKYIEDKYPNKYLDLHLDLDIPNVVKFKEDLPVIEDDKDNEDKIKKKSRGARCSRRYKYNSIRMHKTKK